MTLGIMPLKWSRLPFCFPVLVLQFNAMARYAFIALINKHETC